MTIDTLIAAEVEALLLVRSELATIGDERRITTEARHHWLTLRDIERRHLRTIQELEDLQRPFSRESPALRDLWSSSRR